MVFHSSSHGAQLILGYEFPAVEAGDKLVDVSAQMFETHPVIDSVIAALGKRPEGLNAVGIRLPANISPTECLTNWWPYP